MRIQSNHSSSIPEIRAVTRTCVSTGITVSKYSKNWKWMPLFPQFHKATKLSVWLVDELNWCLGSWRRSLALIKGKSTNQARQEMLGCVGLCSLNTRIRNRLCSKFDIKTTMHDKTSYLSIYNSTAQTLLYWSLQDNNRSSNVDEQTNIRDLHLQWKAIIFIDSSLVHINPNVNGQAPALSTESQSCQGVGPTAQLVVVHSWL